MSRPRLALLGRPAGPADWPRWPPADEAAEAAMLDAFRSGRWTITSPGRGEPAWEPRFGAAFAEFCETRYGVPTANGSSALSIALAASGVRAGDEVIVPVLTWVACAAAVLSLGAIPVPVDVSREDLCLRPDAVAAAISERTVAVIVVHQNCSVADMAGLEPVIRRAGLALIEDCSHAHGARVQGRRVGTFGLVGAFSLQQNKLLACGEGGVAVTADPEVFDTLQQLRANGRRYTSPASLDGELVEVGAAMGDNLVLSELSAAIALVRLGRLNDENARRAASAAHLDRTLGEITGVRPIVPRPGDEPGYHKYTVWLDREAFAGAPMPVLAEAVTAEVGFSIGVLDTPIVGNPLYRPDLSPRRAPGQPPTPLLAEFPVAVAASESCLTIRHHALLADRSAIDRLAEALSTVQRHASDLL